MSNFTDQQLKAITTIDNNVAVSAGAGSGKTRVLVERFLHILEQGKNVSPKEILAITFTRKAAGEMKERVRTSMEDRLAADVNGFWKNHLQELERAQITTIHGFCNRLLKENPVETGLDPAFKLAEEFEGEEYLQTCLLDFVRQGLKKQQQELIVLTNAYGINGTLNQLQSLVQEMDDIIAFGDLTTAYQKTLDDEPAAKARLCNIIEEFSQRNDLGKTKTAEAVALLKENLHDVLDGIKKEATDFTAYDTYLGKLRSSAKIKEQLEEIRSLKASLLNLDVDRAALPLVEAWQKVLQDFTAYYRARKSEDDFLTYDDLEELAVKLLKENEEVRHRYQKKYRYLMVDEFQDTNDRQKQLIYLLCGDDATNLQGRKLFVVGDPKQSIYRFRGADVSVFAEVRQAIKAQGGVDITLPDNFRTVDKILEACNEVFEELLGTDEKQDVFFEPLIPHNTSENKPVLLQVPYDKNTKDKARQLEAEAVARHIKELHQQGKAYGGMAILLSAMTACNVMTEALEKAKIPYQIVDGKGFYERQEVLDFLHLLTVLQNRERSLELAGVLRSPYFGISDEIITKMFLIVNAERRSLWDVLMDFDVTSIKEPHACLVEFARNNLAYLRNVASLLALPELLEKIMRVLRLEAVMYLQENGIAKFANVKKLIGLAQEHCASKQGTLTSWLEYVAALRKAQARETAANVHAADAVTIMTIHKSKGLEFDTVYLPMLDRRGASDVSIVKFHKQLGLGVKAVLDNGETVESSVLSKIKDEDKKLQKAEKQRQLYVAMTRAKNRLVMSGAFNEEGDSNADNWFNDLRGILQDSDNVENVIVDMREESLEPKVVEEDLDYGIPNDELLEDLASYCASGKNYFSPSSLQTYLHCERQYFYQQEGLPALEGEGEGGGELPPHAIGSIVHKALELYDGKDLEVAFNKAVEEFTPGNVSGTAKAKQMLENYVASDLYKALPKNKLKEMQFALPVDDLLVSGVVDCVVETADGLLLVDYKTGRPPKQDEVKVGYAYQLAIYKYAVEKLLNKKVIEAKLHFLQNLSEWSMPMDKDYLDASLALCNEIRSKAKEEDFTCNLANCKYCPYNYLCPQK
mgnify:CR=1 FL=1